MIRITQLSDTHFAADGARSHGGMGYDTDASFAAVLGHLADTAPADLTIVTGDVADHGEADEYRKAMRQLARLAGPLAVLPGNHDFHTPFETMLPSTKVMMPRTLRMGDWLFVFLDTNHDAKVLDQSGHFRDRPDRIHTNGNISAADVEWIGWLDKHSDAKYLFVWGHHPPFVPGAFNVPAYDERAEAVLANPKVRGMAAGHVHTDHVLEAKGRPVYICPSLTFNFCTTAYTSLPPGYRTFEFGDDGTVASTCHLLDDARWPRFPLPEAGIRYLKGELAWDDLLRELGLAK